MVVWKRPQRTPAANRTYFFRGGPDERPSPIPVWHHHGLGELSVSSGRVKLLTYHSDEELANPR